MPNLKKTLLSLAALTAIGQADGHLDTLTPLTDIIPETKGSLLDKVSIGGYGKVDYYNYLDSGKIATWDNYRMILYIGYQFTDNIKYVSEVEWEHGGVVDDGESRIEQSYIDFRVNDALSFKVGHTIVPVGWVNLYHEPTAFYAVNRPEIERNLIPSTWDENGIIAHGKISEFSYQAGIMAGFDADGATSIRKMRQLGINSKSEDIAFVARVDYNSVAGFNIGASIFSGNAGQGKASLDGVKTTISEIHAGFNYAGFNVRGLYAMSTIDNANKIVAKSIVDGDAIGVVAEGQGYYLTAGYSIGEWTPFVRYEAYNDKKVSYDNTGARNDENDDISIATFGLNYKPTPGVVLKANYVMRDDRGTDDDRFELGMGYNF